MSSRHEVPGPPAAVPRCPITGAPAKRCIQRISRRFLEALWRYSHGVDVSPLLAGVDAVGLWESPCGLAFFEPMLAGDRRFYEAFYRRIDLFADLDRFAAERSDFLAARRCVSPGQAVLEVGCGSGALRGLLPEAAYTGLEPLADGRRTGPGVRCETLEQHVDGNRERYDVVCALQVIEHVADPLAFAAAMLATLKPGGLMLLSAPLWPSLMTEIPNIVLNAPPHHLSWWGAAAYRALCARLGLEVVEITALPLYRRQGVAYWTHRLSWVKARDRSYRASAAWFASLALASVAARAAAALRGVPADAPPIDVFLAARKPA